MFLTSIFYTFPLKKITSAIVLFCFLLNGISPAFAAWDDYEQGRTAFEEGRNRDAYRLLQNVRHLPARPYLERIRDERKSRGKLDITPNDLTPEELQQLEAQLAASKDHPQYCILDDGDLRSSHIYRQWLKESQKKPKKPPTLNITINGSFHGNYLYATWLESTKGLKAAAKFYIAALDREVLSAFRRFQQMSPSERLLFPTRDVYEWELQQLGPFDDGIFDRIYTMSLHYKRMLQTTTNETRAAYYAERSTGWLRYAARRGNNLKAQQDLCLSLDTEPVELAVPTQITTFPSFPSNLEESQSAPPLLLKQKTQEEEEADKKNIHLSAYAAENGHGMSALLLGQAYERGLLNGIPSLTQAFYWYNRAVDLGVTEAHIMVGACHEYAKGTKEDLSLAIFHYRKAGEAGIPLGMYNAATLATRPSILNLDEAIYWLRRSVSVGHLPSYAKLAALYTSDSIHQNNEEAARLMREFFANSHFTNALTSSQNSLDIRKNVDSALSALVYRRLFSDREQTEIFKFARYFQLPSSLLALGENLISQTETRDDLRQNALEAFAIVTKTGIENEVLLAMKHLGILALDWVPRDMTYLERIRKGLQDLCDHTHVPHKFDGQALLALGYYLGTGIYEQDLSRAAFHYEKACALYDEAYRSNSQEEIDSENAHNAFYNLASIYMKDATSPNYEKALPLIRRALSIPSPEGVPYADDYHLLALYFYKKELGDKRTNLREAFRSLEIAAGEKSSVFPKGGSLYALYDLGEMYRFGNEYVDPDFKAAEAYFQKAAERGLTQVYFSLGSLALSGSRTDFLKALPFWEEGAKKNDTRCLLILSYFYSIGRTGVFEPNEERALEYRRKAEVNGVAPDAIERIFEKFRDQFSIEQKPSRSEKKSPPSQKTGESLSAVTSDASSIQTLVDLRAEITSNMKWREVENLLSVLTKSQGGTIEPGHGSVQHFHIGDIRTSMHRVHKSGHGRGLGHGRAKDLQALVDHAIDNMGAAAAAGS